MVLFAVTFKILRHFNNFRFTGMLNQSFHVNGRCNSDKKIE